MPLMEQLPQISPADANPARELEVQLKTRITTQSLHYRSGSEETAATSCFKIFDTVRDLLIKHGTAHAFDYAATFLLNSVLRPYTARWHGSMVEGRFKNEFARRT